MVPVVVGAIRLIEWIFRHSKPIPFFSPRVRWGIALAGICIAQFIAYSDLSDENGRLSEAKTQAESAVTRLKATVQGQVGLLAEKDRRIEELASKLGLPPKPVGQSVRQPSQPLAQRPFEPPVLTGLRLTQQRVPSDKPDTPYGLEVVVQTDATIQPVAIVIECDGEISEGRGGVGSGAYTKTKQGVVVDHSNWFLLSWETPAFAPSTPIRATLFSKGPIKAVSVRRVEYSWP